MTIRHLKIFISVADNLKMSAAANELHISQPSISQAISEIEGYYNVLLFERLNRRLYITEEGKRLLNYARHIVTLFDDMEMDMKEKQNVTNLNIGATITVGTCVFNKLIPAFEKENSDIKVNVFIDNTESIEDKLLQSQLDLAVVEGEIKNHSLICKSVYDDELVLVCGNSLFEKDTISISYLKGKPFILREQGSGTRELFTLKLIEENVDIYEKWVCNNTEAIKNAVINGQGYTVISKRLVDKEVKENILHILSIDGVEFNRTFKLVYHKNKYISDQIKRYIGFMNSFHI